MWWKIGASVRFATPADNFAVDFLVAGACRPHARFSHRHSSRALVTYLAFNGAEAIRCRPRAGCITAHALGVGASPEGGIDGSFFGASALSTSHTTLVIAACRVLALPALLVFWFHVK